MNACPHVLLTHPDLGVRPPGVPLPEALARDGGLLAEVFRRWLRQRDDVEHAAEKDVLVKVMRALPDQAVSVEARKQAQTAATVGSATTGWNHWLWAVPACTIGALLGLRMDTPEQQRWLVEALRTVAAALGTDATSAEVQAANACVHALLMALREAESVAPDAPLQAAWLHHTRTGCWADALTGEAQRLALLWQSHEAGTALLSHGLRHLADTGLAPDRHALRVMAKDGGAVRLTRRFALKTTCIEGVTLPEGAPVTVHLVGDDLAFGAGAHACPGRSAALACIESALQWAAAQTACALPGHFHPLVLSNMKILLAAPAGQTMEVSR